MSYWLDAVNIHSLQSPFVYEVYKNVIDKRKRVSADPQIEKIREKFKSSLNVIEVNDLVSWSSIEYSEYRNVTDIASYGVTEKKYSQIMLGLIQYMNFKNVIELGTSLGINTLYLSKPDQTQVTTFEGSTSLVNIATELLNDQRKNVQVVEGNIDTSLPKFLETSPPIDLAFLDANHSYNPTLKYFDLLLGKSHDETCFIFDDIHLSREMNEAWKHIRGHYQVTLTLDLFQIGMVFINPEIRKRHYVLET